MIMVDLVDPPTLRGWCTAESGVLAGREVMAVQVMAVQVMAREGDCPCLAASACVRCVELTEGSPTYTRGGL